MSQPSFPADAPLADPSFCRLPGRSARFVAAALAPWVARLIRCEGSQSLQGLADPALFALNHNNTLECCAVPLTLVAAREGRPIHFLVDWMYLRIPVLGWLLSRIEPIPVYGKRARFGLGEPFRRRQGRRAALDHALEFLAAGRSVGLFPEGTRNRAAELLAPARRGVGWLALAAAVPVVPVGIEFDRARERGRVPRLGRMTIRIGAPRRYSDRPRALDEVERGEARRVIDDVMERLAELSRKRAPGTGPTPRRASKPTTSEEGDNASE